MSAAKPASRIAWVDHAKGLGITLVVLGHTLRGLEASKILKDSALFHFVDNWIYAFHMPLFFVLSGMFAERQTDRRPVSFLADKLAVLAYPYMIWSCLQTLIQSLAGGYTNHEARVTQLTEILTKPMMQFWFLYALFLISVIYYLLRRIGLGPVGVLSGFFLFWATSALLPVGNWSPLLAARRNGVYFALGSVLHQRGITRQWDRISGAILASVAVMGFGVLAYGVSKFTEPLPPMRMGFALLGIASSIAAAILIGRSRALDFVRVLGLYSLEIYVAHTIASAGLRMGMQKVLQIQNAPIHLVIGTLGGLCLPVLLAMLCRRYHMEFLFRFPRRGMSSQKPAKELALTAHRGAA